MNDDPPAIFAPLAGRVFAEAVCGALGVVLAAHDEHEFEDGEHRLRPRGSVRGRDVYVVQSLHADPRRSIDEKLVRLLFFIGALKDADARSVTAVVPYLAYSRKDRKSQPGDPVSTRYVAAMLESVGTDRVMTLDVHNLAAYQNAFRCRTAHLDAAPVLIEQFVPLLGDDAAGVVSPDAGGIKRAEAFRQRLAARLGRDVGAAFVEKHRADAIVRGGGFAGDVAGRVAIIVDDLISTGTTIARAARSCRDAGATHVWAAASHGVFTVAANATLGASGIERIVVTDTVPLPAFVDAHLAARVSTVSVAPLFAQAIGRIHRGESTDDLGVL